MQSTTEENGKMRLPIAAVCLAISALSWVAPTARADCFDEAASYHRVNPWILRAIAAQESRFNPKANHPVNSNGTRDHGMTGINDVLLPELSRYGVTAGDLLDGCKSIYLAGWHLRKMVNKYGNTWDAVGAYNSKTPSKRDIYKEKIRRIINFWIAKGIISSEFRQR
jgi:soluble lytic murein transglycosylase-like protein